MGLRSKRSPIRSAAVKKPVDGQQAIGNQMVKPAPMPRPEEAAPYGCTRLSNKAFEITTKRAKISIRPVGREMAVIPTEK